MDEKYFIAKITTDMPDENTGKIKKMRIFSHTILHTGAKVWLVYG